MRGTEAGLRTLQATDLALTFGGAMLRECDGLLQYRRYWIRAAEIHHCADRGLVPPSSAATEARPLFRQLVVCAGVVDWSRGRASPQDPTGKRFGPSSLAYVPFARLPCLW